MMNLEATKYVQAAARCINMYRMQKAAGTKRMEERANATNDKLSKHLDKIVELTGMSWEEAREIVQERYEKVFC